MSDNHSDTPDDLDGVRLWIAEHDARINGYWHTQWSRNKEMRKDINSTFDHVIQLKMRLIWITGAVAGASFVSTMLANVIFSKLKGQ